MTLADMALFNVNNGMLPIPDAVCGLENFPKIKALCDKVGSNPGIKSWIASRPS